MDGYTWIHSHQEFDLWGNSKGTFVGCPSCQSLVFVAAGSPWPAHCLNCAKRLGGPIPPPSAGEMVA